MKQAGCKCGGVNHFQNFEEFKRFEYKNKVTEIHTWRTLTSLLSCFMTC